MLIEYGARVQPRHLRKTRVLALVCLLAVVLAAVWEGMALYRQTVQRHLDREFDRALAQNPRRLLELVRQGASVTSPPERGRGALLSASLSGEVDVFIAHGARLRSLEDARWLPREGTHPVDPIDHAPDLLVLLEEAPAAHRTPAYWETLGEVRYILGLYANATSAFQQSLRGNPADPEAKAGLRLSSSAARIVAEIRKADPHLPSFVQVREVPGGPAQRCVVLSGETDDLNSTPRHISDIRLSLWEAGRRWRRLWQSQPLCDPRMGNDEYHIAQLFRADLNCDGSPEFVVYQYLLGGDWEPTQALVFHHHDNGLERELAVRGETGLLISPDDAGGRYTLMGDHVIGSELSRAEQPRWTDYYAWREGRWRLANADFPVRFDELDQEIRKAREAHPKDPELLIGAARIATYHKCPEEARRLFQDALRQVNQTKAGDEWSRKRVGELGRVIRAELHALPPTPANP